MALIQKFVHFFQRLFKCIAAFPSRRKEFGFRAAFAISVDFLFPPGKSRWYIRTISRRVDKELSPLVERYLESDSRPEPIKPIADLGEKTPVWVCWWQGEESMPELVRACFHQLQAVIPQEKAQIHLVTMENMAQYVRLPGFILDKFEAGQISYAFLSDILRYALLNTYGGVWVDSTDYLTQPLDPRLLESDYFTQRFASEASAPKEACRGKWCNFYLAGRPNNPLFAFVCDSLLFWCSSHKFMIDYVFVDYVIWTGYCRIPEIRRLIDAVPANNEQIWALSKRLNDPFDEKEFALLIENNAFYKLSYKAALSKMTADGKQTIYGHLLEKGGIA